MSLSKSEKKYLKDIALLYGAKVKFDDRTTGGYFDLNETIHVGTNSSKESVISVFCHELAHFVNKHTGAYPLFHNYETNVSIMSIIGDFNQTVDYVFEAELYTEKVGKKICAEWFPGIEYQGFYRKVRYCREFLVGYYLRGVDASVARK